MIDAAWIKMHIKAGRISPAHGCTCFNPRWPAPHQTRTLWTGIVEQCRVSFYPAGREIDMETLNVSSAGKFEEQ